MVMTVVLGLRAEDNTSLYDQVHGDGQGADELLSPKWWQDLVFASQEAKPDDRLTPSGLTGAVRIISQRP